MKRLFIILSAFYITTAFSQPPPIDSPGLEQRDALLKYRSTRLVTMDTVSQSYFEQIFNYQTFPEGENTRFNFDILHMAFSMLLPSGFRVSLDSDSLSYLEGDTNDPVKSVTKELSRGIPALIATNISLLASPDGRLLDRSELNAFIEANQLDCIGSGVCTQVLLGMSQFATQSQELLPRRPAQMGDSWEAGLSGSYGQGQEMKASIILSVASRDNEQVLVEGDFHLDPKSFPVSQMGIIREAGGKLLYGFDTERGIYVFKTISLDIKLDRGIYGIHNLKIEENVELLES